MAPTLYHVSKTISSPIYQILRLELGLADSEVKVAKLSISDLKSQEHLARNPMGTSPTLTDSEAGFTIWESGAILTYLLTTYDTEYRLHPNPMTTSKTDLAKFLHIQQFIIATPFLASLYTHVLQNPGIEDDYVTNAKNKFRSLLRPVLQDFLGDSDFFLGSNISAIDFLVAKPLSNADSLGQLEDFPALSRILKRIKCHRTFATAYEVDVEDHCNCRGFRLAPSATGMDNNTANQESLSTKLQ
jgi:glutathione S-transferase